MAGTSVEVISLTLHEQQSQGGSTCHSTEALAIQSAAIALACLSSRIRDVEPRVLDFLWHDGTCTRPQRAQACQKLLAVSSHQNKTSLGSMEAVQHSHYYY